MMRRLFQFCALVFTMTVQAGTTVPTEFRDNRIFVRFPASDGRLIEWYTDSGGGINAVLDSTATALGLKERETINLEGPALTLVEFPRQAIKAGVPAPKAVPPLNGGLVRMLDIQREELSGATGFLGSRWFAGRVWEFDYPSRTLSVHSRWKRRAGETVEPIGFIAPEKLDKQPVFGRLTVSIDGQTLDLLFDTGATITLTEVSAPVLGKKAGDRIGGSFISAAVFDVWRRAHPDWRVIDVGDAIGNGAVPVIEVPAVTIAGHTVGPVWFARRAVGNFEQWISEAMDKPVVGGAGGSLLQYFHVVVDYPNGRAYFSRPARR